MYSSRIYEIHVVFCFGARKHKLPQVVRKAVDYQARLPSAPMSSSKGKGKEPATLPPLPGPSSGSANPAASLSALWAYLLPALNHIVKSPTNNSDKAPAIDIGFYAGIHTACYN
jgi:hypothetical protein